MRTDTMGGILIKNGHIIDPANRVDARRDVLVEGGRIAAVGTGLSAPDAQVIDAAGLYVLPGFVDLHAHLREPGREDEETIRTGTRAAAAGGFTSVCAMPNTTPIIDRATGINYLRSATQRDAVVNVFPAAAVTVGQQGKEITEFGDLIQRGAVAFTDDGHCVADAEIMRRALEYTAMFDVPVLDHCEDPMLKRDGVIHEGRVSMMLGLRGIPAVSETVIVARDIALAEYVGGHVHIQHVSARRSVELIREGKRRGVRVTAEVTPHHLALTEEACLNFDTNAKVAPPLRSEDDRQALIEGLLDGTLDAIATDHAPHTDIEKDMVFTEAPFGMIGLEFAFAVCHGELVATGRMDLAMLVARMTAIPAAILRLNKGTLSVGADADITIVDLGLEKTVSRGTLLSKSYNTPFLGKTLRGFPVHTLVGGRLVYSNGRIV
ncbi:MAG: dihydroorotase [Candidatus Sumerlaeia bacterium]|nr:dihydroorotase [Candidatus Sumerlaeia bacterium]